MNLLNAISMPAAYTMGMRPDGREMVVVVVKGTFAFPGDSHRVPELAKKQVPLVMADEFTGEPGFSAARVEADFAPCKPKAEVLLNGSAYAPRGRPATEVEVGLSVGSLNKSFRVVGNRVWRHGALGPVASSPEPFVTLPITYDVAFGGRDESGDPSQHSAYAPNPIGRGYHGRPLSRSIADQPLCNTEELGRPVTDPRGTYRPMAFGPWGRSWPPRLGYAGTYDENWLARQFPFLPADFDDRYYQSAPEDQQLDRLQGGDVVELRNLTPEGLTRFPLPRLTVPVEFVLRDYESVEQVAVLDTLLIEADQRQFSLVWRASLPLKQNMFEVTQIIVGKMPRGWYRARSLGKSYYGNLNELIQSRTS